MFVIVKHLHRHIIRQPQKRTHAQLLTLTLTIHNYRHIHKTDTIARKKEEEEKKKESSKGEKQPKKKKKDGVVGGLWMGGVASLSTLVT